MHLGRLGKRGRGGKMNDLALLTKKKKISLDTMSTAHH